MCDGFVKYNSFYWSLINLEWLLFNLNSSTEQFEVEGDILYLAFIIFYKEVKIYQYLVNVAYSEYHKSSAEMH